MHKFYIFLFIFYIFNPIYSKPLTLSGIDKLSIDDVQIITSIDLYKKDLSINEINTIISDLYKSDLIYDLNFTEKDNRYEIEIIENNLIQNVFITNNNWIKDELLFELLRSKPNNFLSKKIISHDIKIIESLYKSKGFNNVSVTAKLESFSKDRDNLIFEVYEGTRSKLNIIKFKGNKYFSDKFLSSKITSQALSFYNIFKSGSNLNPDIFDFDKTKIKQFYKEQGFLDVKVTYELDSNLLGVYSLVFFIDEGEPYEINNISYPNQLTKHTLFDEAYKNFSNNLKKNNNFYNKEIFSDFLNEINNSLVKNNINNYYVNFELLLLDDNKIDINFKEIYQKPTAINKIDIYGNAITKEKTLRSKFLIQPGDYYNQFLVENSISNLKKFSYINDITYEVLDNSNNTSDIAFAIDEQKKTGNILFAGTYNSDTELGFTFGIEDKNFAGTGNIIDANFDINTENLKYDINYTQFPIYNPFLSNTYSIFNQESDLSSSFGFKSTRQGLGYRINFSDNDQINYGIGITYQYTKGHSPKNSSNQSVTDNIGQFDDIILRFNINKNNTNDIFNPTDGHLNSLSFIISPDEISDDSFYKLIYTNKNYFNLKNTKNYIFFNNNVGLADSFQSKLKTINSFSLGGNNFKGFDFRGIGPKDNNIYLGGNKFFTSTIGYGSSFIFDEKDNIYTKLFISSGSVWDSDYALNNDFELRNSLGVSLDFITAVGPISFTYASPISKQSGDKERSFFFTIGSSF